eukprot:gene12690-13991_t
MGCLTEILQKYTSEQLPKLFVFDLDYTIWPFWVDTHVQPPFSKDKQTGIVFDYFKRKVEMYPGVLELLQNLKEFNCSMAAASRTDTPKEALDLLKVFGIHDLFDLTEIYPGRKTTHFSKFKTTTGFAYVDMIFFDDEIRNINDISKLGVTCIHVEDGLNSGHFAKGLRLHNDR